METVTTILLSAMIAKSHSYDNSNLKALRTLALYSYKNSEVERNLKSFVKNELPDEFKNNVGIVVAIVTVVHKKRVEFIWTF